MITIAPIDWIVLIAYLAIVSVIGVVASARIKDTSHYFLGGRRFGRWLMIAQSFGTGTHAEMPVSLAGIVYTLGLSGIWYQWKNLFATPFYWLLAPLFRRFRRTTLAEVVTDRYGPMMGTMYTVFALCFFTINMASMLKGAAKVIDQAMGGNLPVNGIVIAMTVVFVAYSFIGGLVATAWTDLLQGILIIALSFMLIPAGWKVVGGIHGMKAGADLHRFSLTAPAGIDAWFITVLTLNGLIGIVAQPQLIASVGTGKDELTCRIGHLGGTFIKRFCTIGWAIVGLIVATVIGRGTFGVTKLSDPEQAFGFACRQFLFPGGVGLLIASFLAANMAASSAFMVDSGALFTNDIYRKYFIRFQSDHHYLWVGRISGVLITLLAVCYAVFAIKRVLYSFLLTETAATFVGISILLGIFWRRANHWGAASSIVAALAVNFGGYRYTGRRLDDWEPGIFLLALVAGIATAIVVSLLTPPEPPEATDAFYRNLHTPSDQSNEALTSEKALAEAGRQLLLVNALHLRRGAWGVGIFRAYRTDLLGFGFGWMIALALIAFLFLLFHL